MPIPLSVFLYSLSRDANVFDSTAGIPMILIFVNFFLPCPMSYLRIKLDFIFIPSTLRNTLNTGGKDSCTAL